MSYKAHIIHKAGQGTPFKYGSPSPSPNAGIPQGARGFDSILDDEDPDVCLSCELPPEKCYGNKQCYEKRKRKNENRD